MDRRVDRSKRKPNRATRINPLPFKQSIIGEHTLSIATLKIGRPHFAKANPVQEESNLFLHWVGGAFLGPTTPHHILAIDNAPFDDNSIDRLKRAKRPDDSQVKALKIPSYQRPRHIASRKRALRVGLELNIYQLLDRTVQIRKSTMSIYKHNRTETLIVQKSVTANFAKMLTLHGLCFAGMAHHTPANLTLVIRAVHLTNVAL